MRYLSSKEIALYVWQSTRSDGYNKTILDLVGARKRGKINVVNENILEDPPSISSRILWKHPLFILCFTASDIVIRPLLQDKCDGIFVQ